MAQPQKSPNAHELTPQVTITEDLKRLIAAKYPIVYVVTYEDHRLEGFLKQVSAKAFSQPIPYWSWSITDGLRNAEGKAVEGSTDPVKAIGAIINDKNVGLYLLKDFHTYMNDDAVIRKLRDAYQALKNNYKTIFISAPRINIPGECVREVNLYELPLPTLKELNDLFKQIAGTTKNLQLSLSEEELEEFGKAALGLTLDESRVAFNKVCLGKTKLSVTDVNVVIEEKSLLVKREGILEFVNINFGLEEVGGLKNLKNWLNERARFFSKEASDFGISPPKGVLMTGVSGCGKSLCVKAISKYWKLPLMRLDMTKVFGGVSGNPEFTMQRALATVEALAPVVLWIDEIENGLAGSREGDAGVTNRIFSSFLTWMQEHKTMVFVAATANQINQLPAEFLRKGRFDEIFFVDLPSEEERKDIFRVHLQKRGHDPAKFNLINLSKGTTNFNGAEIESCVVTGLFSAFNEKRPLHENDLYRAIGKIVPLATTMAETIKVIKRWADTRAVKAS